MSNHDKPMLIRRETLQALTRLRSPRGNDWCVLAYMINPDAADDTRGVVFPLGAFDDEKRAEKHAKSIIELTGYRSVVVARYATGIPLTIKLDGKTVVDVPVDSNGKLKELESAQYKYEREQYEKRVKHEEEVQREAEAEVDPDSIEHYKRQWYLAIKNRAAYEHHKKQMNEAWTNYKKYETAIHKHYTAHPEHDAQWLPYLKDKLVERGEEALYNSIAAGYNKLRDELLKPVLQTECDGDICLAPSVATNTVDSSEESEDELIAPDNVASV